MKIKKISDEKALDQALKLKLKDYRYGVLFFRKGRKKINLYPALAQAEADFNYTYFDRLWADRPQIFKDTLCEQVARVELKKLELPELATADVKKILQSSKTEESLVKLIKKVYYECEDIIAVKESFFTNEWSKIRGDYVRALYCRSDKLSAYVMPEKKKKKVGGSTCQRQSLGQAGGSVPVFELPLPQRAGLE
jgi:hypothetical protein